MYNRAIWHDKALEFSLKMAKTSNFLYLNLSQLTFSFSILDTETKKIKI